MEKPNKNYIIMIGVVIAIDLLLLIFVSYTTFVLIGSLNNGHSSYEFKTESVEVVNYELDLFR